MDPQGLPLAVDKVGHLCRAFEATDDGVRDEILAGTQRALRRPARPCGVEAYLNYGALLGAVRDGAMIAHDSDTDVCYLSRHESPADLIARVVPDRARPCAAGWTLLRMSGGDIKLLLPLSDGRVCHIDVFVAFRVAGTFYQLGDRSGQLSESAILPLSAIDAARVPPSRRPPSRAMLAFVYGPGWRTPDPSFKYADPLPGIRRLDGWLRGFRTDMGRWTEFYRGPDGPGPPASAVHLRPLGGRAGAATGRPWPTWVRPGPRRAVLRPSRPRRRGVRLLSERASPGRPPGQTTGPADRSHGC